LSSYQREGRSAGILGNKVQITRDITTPATPEAQLWDGWGTALKPAVEPVCLAMKPIDGTYAENALKWGVAGLNIDGGRVWHDDKIGKRTVGGFTSKSGIYHGDDAYKINGQDYDSTQGRFPANVIHDGSDEVTGLFPETKSGNLNSGHKRGDGTGNSFMGGGGVVQGNYGGDSGSAARFFYCAKASRRERNAGLEGMEERDGGHYAQDEWSRNNMGSKPDAERKPVQNHHPTVKPVALMEYLAKLTKTPTGGVVLDPFMGSGTTGIACVKLGRPFIGIELDEDYFEIAKRRILHAMKQPRLV
jgi:site-specific DNA-methyltransferase (adenine-specific)